MNNLRSILPGFLIAVMALLNVFSTSISVARADPRPSPFTATLTPLLLENGWLNAPFGTSVAAVTNMDGIVYFKGAIYGGTSPRVFTLPVGFRPPTNVYIPVDLCNATKGQLLIRSFNNQVTVITEGPFSDAQCFISLDGASFALSPPVSTPLTLQNGWVNSPLGTSAASVSNIAGIVHLKGAIAGGTNSQVFTLPAGVRPLTNVYVPVSLCQARQGRLLIQPSGQVTVYNERGFSSLALCFISLDGASFALSPTLAPLTLENGWTNAPFGTSPAAAINLYGVVHLKGAISGGRNPQAFTLPVGVRPTTAVYVPVDLCNATKGRLIIQPSGQVTVQAQGPFSNAQCFTSLDRAKFALSAPALTLLTLENGWVNGGGPSTFNTSPAAVTNIDGIVHFKGAVYGGASPQLFTLPVGFRPASAVYVLVGLCGSAGGRLLIQPGGQVTVQAQGPFSNAQCFTSLDGASFALSPPILTLLTLQNGWTNAPLGTSDAAVTKVNGIVHFKGGIAGGTSPRAFTLSVDFQPATDVYVPVSLCNDVKGRLRIQPGGVVTVQAERAFSDAQCFTSLDGASFAVPPPGLTGVTLQNGWTNAPLGTGDAAVTNIDGIVHFKGAVAGGANQQLFTLPAGFRPAASVPVPIDLCNATKGLLLIQPGGEVLVLTEGPFSNAQCFTSLDGASFAR